MGLKRGLLLLPLLAPASAFHATMPCPMSGAHTLRAPAPVAIAPAVPAARIMGGLAAAFAPAIPATRIVGGAAATFGRRLAASFAVVTVPQRATLAVVLASTVAVVAVARERRARAQARAAALAAAEAKQQQGVDSIVDFLGAAASAALAGTAALGGEVFSAIADVDVGGTERAPATTDSGVVVPTNGGVAEEEVRVAYDVLKKSQGAWDKLSSAGKKVLLSSAKA
jgi:hypothetical protein